MGFLFFLIRILVYWYSHMAITVRLGNQTSAPSTCPMLFTRVEFLFFNMYKNDFSVFLNTCGTIINDLMYADDLVIASPYSAGSNIMIPRLLEPGEHTGHPP